MVHNTHITVLIFQKIKSPCKLLRTLEKRVIEPVTRICNVCGHGALVM